ncbi:hypothetical protein V8E52_009190 [Russula decolorans]
MVTTPSIASDYEAKRQRPTLEKSKVVTLSKQLQIRLQYARLKVEHGWQRQSLNEVENLYFHHSTLKGKSKALRPLSSAPTTALGPNASTSTASPKATSGHTKDGNAIPESSLAAHPISVSWSPGAVAASSSPTVASPSSTPIKSPSSRMTRRASTPGGTPAQAQASESARSVTLSSSVLSAFTQDFTTTQQLSREATMDFASLSPFVTAPSFSSSGSSITAPSSFVSTVPPSPFASQTLAYQPSPFAPPPSSSVPVPPAPSLPMSQFTSPPYPTAVQPSGMSASLETFPPNLQATFPSLVEPHLSSPSPTPSPAPAPTSVSTPALASPPASARARSPAPALPPSSKRIHSPAPAATPAPPQKPPPSASTHPHSSASLSSFRPSKTFDIPTAPGPVTSTVGTGTQSTTMLTYDSFWSSHSSSAGGWRKAIVSNNSSSSSGNSRSPAASASAVTGGITTTPASSAAGGGLLGVRGSSAKA